jgi:hypothetical protein
MFVDILSLDEIFKVWDTLLISPPVMPLFVALAILQQFRASLLTFDFNQCILFFSNFPSIDISMCLKEAKELFDNTPLSLTMQRQPKTESPVHNLSRWGEKQVSLDELSKYLSPQISVSDIVSSSFHYTILDVRSFQEYPLSFISFHFI